MFSGKYMGVIYIEPQWHGRYLMDTDNTVVTAVFLLVIVVGDVMKKDRIGYIFRFLKKCSGYVGKVEK